MDKNYFDHLDDSVIEKICQHLETDQNYKTLLHLSQTSLRMHKVCHQILKSGFKQYVNSNLVTLNEIGPNYHGWFGYRDWCDEDETGEVIMNVDELKDEAQTEIPFQTVVIKYTSDYWLYEYTELYKWYNQTSSCFYKENKDTHLPPLNTRPYIEINVPFMEIHISRQKKGQLITLDDILFATRGLMVDDTRIVDDGYKLLSYEPNVLILEPLIDNLSL
jgi:hypothetical protein